MKNYLMKNNNSNLDLFNFFDDAFNGYFKPVFFSPRCDYMLTDIIENDDNYELNIELPGWKKEDIEISIDNDYLTVEAKSQEKEEKKHKANYLRRERSFSCSRSYYVGDVRQEDIKAKFENGLLRIVVPKESSKDSKQLITIE